MEGIHQVRLYHWGIAIAAALFMHVFFVLYIKQNVSNDNVSPIEQGITIKLKKLTSPPKPIAPVQPSQTVEQIIPAPPKKAPPKPVIQKPKISTAKESMIKKEVEQEVITAKEFTKNSNTDNPVTNVNIPGATKENENNNSSQIRSDYLVRLNSWLAQHKRYPVIARRRKQEDTIIVKFVINANGALLSYQLVEASEFSSLNKAVTKLLLNASPMPEVPHAIRNGRTEFEYTVPIEYALIEK